MCRRADGEIRCLEGCRGTGLFRKMIGASSMPTSMRIHSDSIGTVRTTKRIIMRFSRTQRTNQATSSVDKSRRTVTVNFTVPVSWSQLTQEQLRRVFDLLVVHEDMTVVKTILLVEFCGLTVERKTRFGWKCQTTVDGKGTHRLSQNLGNTGFHRAVGVYQPIGGHGQ